MADDATPDPDPFATLGNEIRLRIVETLADRTDSLAPDAGLAYSTLREAVGVDDKGQFNYHLGLLRDRFVRKTETGYRLTFAGVEVAKTLQVDVWDDPPVREAVEVDPASPLVGGDPLYASYRDGLVRVHEHNGDPIFQIAVRPVGATDRTMAELVDTMATLLEATVAQAHAGVCPYCQSVPERALVDAAESGSAGDGAENGSQADTGRNESADDTTPWRHCFVATCPECGPLFRVPAGTAVCRHPAVVSWYWDRGVDLRTVRLWDLALFGDGAVTTEDPRGSVALRLRVERDGARLELDLANDATVVAVRRA